MHRDPAAFPNDEYGDVLWNWYAEGNVLGSPTNIRFLVLFDAEANAEDFAAEVRHATFGDQAHYLPDRYEVPVWGIAVSVARVPTHACLDALSRLLSSMAEPHGGYVDDFATRLSPNNSFKPKPLRGSA